MQRWSQLSKRTQAQYRRRGVTGRRYNAWQEMSPKRKALLQKRGVSREEYLTSRDLRITKKGDLYKNAIRNITNQLGDRDRFNPNAVRMNVGVMVHQDLVFAGNATAEQLTLKAQATATFNPTMERDYNPFWYH